jgi:multisubunit Na+/H+ antiporter MnhG subunit
MKRKPLQLLSGIITPFPLLLTALFISCLSTGYAQDLPENATISDINSLKDDIEHRTKQDIESSNALEEKRWILSLKTNVTERVNALSVPGKQVDLEKYHSDVTDLIERVINLDCNDGPRYRQETVDIYNLYWNMTSDLPVFEEDDVKTKQKRIDDKFQNLPYEEECQARITLFRNSDVKSELDQLVEAQKKELERSTNEKTQKLDALLALKKEIEVYDRKLDEAAQTANTKMSLQSNLYVMILVIGLLSIATIGIIRWFPPDVMREWVESGQVIQFVTVMILLSVIMALGLAGLLTENTLGTLLGGIGGYVLSQGVGRSAARAAMKQMNERDTVKRHEEDPE